MSQFVVDNVILKAEDNEKDTFDIVSVPRNYSVQFTNFIPNFSSNDFLLIDKNIHNLYGISHHNMIIVEATENNKNIQIVLGICQWLSDKGFNKGHKLYVIGGGITQDIGAFVGSIYKRGINWIYIPTTLLSQCDSCIGGKTALNFNKTKNQLALFSAPESVVIDTRFLQSLNHAEILSGMGEIIKFFLIGGNNYITMLDTKSLDQQIFHGLSIKKSIVEYDEFEKNIRKSLNYGHSFGHAIEAVSDYSIPHGEAVLLGIEVINQLFTKSSLISSMINRYTSLDRIKDLDPSKIIGYLQQDKKTMLNSISLIVVENPGLTSFVPTAIDNNLSDKLYAILTH